MDASPENPAGLNTVDLVRRAQAGDRGAIDGLFARYLPRVRQVVALRLGYGWRRFAAYEDLVQDAMLRIFLKLDAFEERPEGTFRNWVATCVANSVRNSLRRESSARPGGGRIVVECFNGPLRHVCPGLARIGQGLRLGHNRCCRRADPNRRAGRG